MNFSKEYAKNVFNDAMMKKYLPEKVYLKLKNIISNREELDPTISKDVASGMLKWATDNGATFYTHWFQPLTGTVAEKQDSFLRIDGQKPIFEFSGKELIKGETDASSFPSGNIRATFEARGYTVWDCTSPAFIRDVEGIKVLCIPTAFISYGGEALDNKTPLLRSMEVISEESLKILKLFGKKAKKVNSMLGLEQEYFLVDRDKYLKRKDLVYSGRTLFGAKTPKGQELNDHYLGAIKTGILSFMDEVNNELWALGVPAKTRHNEVAPAQHELAVIYEEANVSCDHNQIVMETLKRVARRHNLVCLLHEKPFKWVNGSGKHSNWSLVSDTGINLLNPGTEPHENLQFLLVLSCVVAAVDNYSMLLRASCATPGKEQRLGASEAPPAIISCYLGDQLEEVVEDFINDGESTKSRVGGKIKKDIMTLPEVWLDATDRNRTSPFAFTGNKFEFRMPGSNDSCAMIATVINLIVASEFKKATDELSKSKNLVEDVKKYIHNNFTEHNKIIFNGDGYSKDWEELAKKRGLKYVRSIVDAIPVFIDKDVIKLFGDFEVLSENELRCRYQVSLENYINMTNIEALTMIDLSKKQILPISIEYASKIANAIITLKNANASIDTSVENDLLIELNKNIKELKDSIDVLVENVDKSHKITEVYEKATFFKEHIATAMEKLREKVDTLEMIVDKNMWPMPSYGDLLFEVTK